MRRWNQRRQPARWKFAVRLTRVGKRAGEFAAGFAKGNSLGKIDNDKIDIVAREALAPFESRGRGSENPYEIQGDLQELMQDNVGIVRTESECSMR